MIHHVFEFSDADIGYSLAYAVSMYEEEHGHSPAKIVMSRPMIARLPLSLVIVDKEGRLTYAGIPIIETREDLCEICLCEKSIIWPTQERTVRIKEYSLYRAEDETEQEEIADV